QSATLPPVTEWFQRKHQVAPSVTVSSISTAPAGSVTRSISSAFAVRAQQTKRAAQRGRPVLRPFTGAACPVRYVLPLHTSGSRRDGAEWGWRRERTPVLCHSPPDAPRSAHPHVRTWLW